MPLRTLTKRLAAVSMLTAAAAGAVLVGGPAYADTVTVNYTCNSPLGDVNTDIDITITAPAAAAVGDTVDITVQSGPVGVSVPIDLAAGSLTTSMDVTVSGAQTGTTTVTSAPNPDPIPAGSNVQPQPMTGTLALTAAGQVDLAPGPITVTVIFFGSPINVPCTPTTAPGVASSIQVS